MSIKRVTITALFYGQKCQNVLHFDDRDDSQTDAMVAAEVRDYWIGSTTNWGIHAWCTNSIQWVSVQVQKLASGVWTVPYNLTIAQNGQQSADNQQYTMLCVILKMQTATPGRSGRGRSYCPGLANGFATNGLLNATFHSYADTSLNNMKARFQSGGTGPLLVGVFPKSSITAADFKPCLTLQASTFIGVQRRRNVGFGV